ncbi:accessory Sec system translocase SecA2 [Lactobacillus crispatus]|uniref:Protein translocase subunit SecA n=1 Tax=Lactobacillus crispatus TaxID=47770 RepID=A0A7H9E7C0_9LACO|nr:accessory Sec system translocase SecA2 [Lactobacillus crispatus]QLL73247.1 accessory Sec system translocase SecA2 [Lactobacillus crispatus]
MAFDKLELFKIKRILKKINVLAPKMRKMSDDELKKQTEIFRQRLRAGKTLNSLLPEAYATVREVDYRILGEFPYDVQVMGAIVLNQGAIAEMKTGEGKTLVATMPLYLNALSSKGSILVTTNNYLARRDEENLAPVYEFLGLTVSVGFGDEDSDKVITAADKRKWYNSDILYTTASTLAFDYLFDNLASNTQGQYLRPFNYVVIDEVDEVLLDEAESPFVVSSSPSLQSNLYGLADRFAVLLTPKIDYQIKEQEQIVWLTYHGVKKAEKYFRVNDLFDKSAREIYRHIILALKAHLFMKNGHDYLVVQGKVVLLDEIDGRLKKGIQISTGLHQAIETKEHVDLTPIQKTAATITFPSLFGLFNKVSGMSGTAKVNETEFQDIYGMKVVCIPTRKPVIRKDYKSKIFLTTSDKLLAAIKEIIAIHEAGRPVLLVAGSVENSEIISELLLNYGIAHNVLNAYNAAREAEIIKDAGQEGAVTVATNMAGRGTDIKLGPGVKEKGGLAVIGTEMLPERVKLQLSGRAGRQGDPGSSRFYVSLEDSYVAKASTKRQKAIYRRLWRKKKRGKNIAELHRPITRLGLKMLQGRVESNGATSRMQTNKFEVALGYQRDNYYQLRKTIMDSNNLQIRVEEMLQEFINYYVDKEKKWNSQKVRLLVNEHFTFDNVKIPDDLITHKEVKSFLTNLSHSIIDKKKKVLINDQQLNQFYHQIFLTVLDNDWIDQVDYMNNLRIYTSQWQFSGRSSDYVYEKEAYASFSREKKKARRDIINSLLLSPIYLNSKGQLIVEFS